MGPAVVCYAFSLELYLKLLCVLTGGKIIREHKLDKLYDALPDETKTALVAECSGIDLVRELTSAAEAFEHWRYSHEHERLNISPSMLVEIVERCHRLVHKLKRGLQVFGDNTHVQQCP
jgi:HEPN domain-containing protein